MIWQFNRVRRVIIRNMDRIENLRVLLIDGDGVLYRGNSPISGINRFFKVLAERDIAWGLITNNATKPPEHYVEKLGGYGIDSAVDQIFTSATVTADYMKHTYPQGTAVYVIGELGVQQALRDAGMTVYSGEERPPEPVKAVISALDRTLTYMKLRIATLLIRELDIPLIATNPDKTFPAKEGIVPGAGATIAALEAATGRQAMVIGKPSPTMYKVAMEKLGGEIETTAMLGDRFDTDIAGALLLGLGTILVLSGVTTRAEAEASEIRPDLVLEDIGELAESLAALPDPHSAD
jgi:4-nitrophenyl phosphatase